MIGTAYYNWEHNETTENAGKVADFLEKKLLEENFNENKTDSNSDTHS